MKKKEYKTPTARFFKLNSSALLTGSYMQINNSVSNSPQLGRTYDFSLEEEEEEEDME